MRHCAKLPVWLLVALGLSVGTKALVADTLDSPYLGIAGSNVFRLRPPPPAITNPPPAPLARVKVVGITTFPDNKRALLKVSLPAMPPEPAKEVSCILSVGQWEGPIKVLEIDEITGSVKVNNSGAAVMVLTLEKDNLGPPNRPPAPGPPPLPMQSALRR
jgi:hypothetical protein